MRPGFFPRVVIAVAALAAVSGVALAAETGRIRGRVTDAVNGDALVGASVVVEGTDLGAATDVAGEYLIANVPVGRVTLVVSYISYSTVRRAGVPVLLDQTITENFALRVGSIPMSEVVSVSRRAAIVRTDPTTSRYMGSEEIAKMPVQSLADIVRLQTGIVSSQGSGLDPGMHLRGGRPGEVMYFVDGVGTSDPLYGYQAARVNPEATAEVVVIAGGFDAEYGEAMSGIIQVITKEGKDFTAGRLGFTTDEFLPGGLNFGDNRFEASLGGPFPGAKKLRYFLSGELYLTDDYNPMRHHLDHQQREDYKLTGKLTYSLPYGQGMRLTADGFHSREQYELYPYIRDDENYLGFKYRLDHFLSRREYVTKVGALLNHMLTKQTFYTLRFGYFGDERVQAVRDLEREKTERGFLGDYVFKAESAVRENDSVLFHRMPDYVEQAKDNTNNPFGVYNLFYGKGDYRGFLLHWSDVTTFKGDLTHNIGKVHEFKVGLEVRRNDLHRRYNSLPWTDDPFVDSYDYDPTNVAAFAQDRMDFEDLVVRFGLRLDYLDPDALKRANPTDVGDSALMVAAKSKYKLSPRLGVSFPVTTNTKFRFSYGHFFQTPAYRFLYDNISSAAFTRGNQIIGNPDLAAQQTIAYELGLEHQVSALVVADFTAYYKDVFDLLGTRYQPAIPLGYYPLVNEEYGSVRGFEIGLQKLLADYWNARVSYGLSLARGTASSTYEWYYERYRYGNDPVTGREMEPPRRDYALEFDERHNAKVTLGWDFPSDFGFAVLRDVSGSVLFSYGSGLPYTPLEVRKLNAGRPTGERNSARMGPRYQSDLSAAKLVPIGPVKLGLNLTITNLLGNQSVEWVYGATGLPSDDGYAATLSPDNWAVGSRITSLSSQYHPARDRNHDGYISAEEEYISYKVAYLDFVSNPANFGPPRQVKVGVTFEF